MHLSVQHILLALAFAGSSTIAETANAGSKKLSSRQSPNDNSYQYVVPSGSPGFYHGKSSAAVTFDQHSMFLDGKRFMFFSGEFHPFRLPVPTLWRDVLQKVKAAGFNGVSVYWHWGLVAPNATTLRFTEHNDLAAFFKVAREVGILVIVRPGPYINAESAGGGIPGWTTNAAGLARTNSTDYKKAWLPYITKFAQETAPYQYPDGPVIGVQSENEFTQSGTGVREHMQDLEDALRAGGITKVPLTHNDKWAGSQYSGKGLGEVDLYGFDGYPLGFECSNPSKWSELSTSLDADHQRTAPASPLALFEWQGGSFSYWSGPDYSKCYQLVNEQFANVYYKNNYAAGASAQNLYMIYGGTNWGNMHTHTIYSSYDYGAAIREDRTLTGKLAELKLQGEFLHASPDYLTAVRLGAGVSTTYTTSTEVYTTNLQNPSNKANFYIVRQSTNAKTSATTFQLKVNTNSEGLITIPKSGSITLAGRESKIIVTNYPFGGSSVLEYSTAEVMTHLKLDSLDYIVVYALAGQSVEVAVQATNSPAVTVLGSQTIKASVSSKAVTITGTTSGVSVVSFGSVRVIVADKATASTFWQSRLYSSTSKLYDMSPSVPSVLVQGPYLVRSASISGSTLAITGDINNSTTLNVYAPSAVTAVTWNGASVSVSKSSTGSLTGSVAFPSALGSVSVPVLKNLAWSCADTLPELASGYNDNSAGWVSANKTSTLRPQKPYSGKYVLYAGEYGFHAGQWVWRGHFSGNTATGVQLSIQGGFSFGYSVFVNGNFLGSGQGTSSGQGGTDILSPSFTFSSGQLVSGDNVITVIHDSTGMNQDYGVNDEHKNPRGIRGYKLVSNNGQDFSGWKVAGNVGGENAPDAVRGPYNEGGWWYERVGAHLPGYDASKWTQSCSPYQGLTKPGVTAYRTKFDLNFPAGSDVPLSFDLELNSINPYRLLIYVNGWQFGRFASSLGPQISFPVPEGILNHHGTNEVLVQLWALNNGGAKVTKLDLVKRAVVSSSKTSQTGVVTAPGWSQLRS